jgi:rhodanese-related sulfurtransferase
MSQITKVKLLLLAIASLFLVTIGSYQLATNPTDTEKQKQIEQMYDHYSRKFPEVKSITAVQLKQWQSNQKIIVVDVRTPEERSVSMIPNAIAKAEFEQHLDLYRNGEMIVVYCTIGYRSGKYAQKYPNNSNIYNLEGGILAWSHSGGKLTNPQGHTNKIHVFGDRWKLTPNNYEAVWQGLSRASSENSATP